MTNQSKILFLALISFAVLVLLINKANLLAGRSAIVQRAAQPSLAPNPRDILFYPLNLPGNGSNNTHLSGWNDLQKTTCDDPTCTSATTMIQEIPQIQGNPLTVDSPNMEIVTGIHKHGPYTGDPWVVYTMGIDQSNGTRTSAMFILSCTDKTCTQTPDVQPIDLSYQSSDAIDQSGSAYAFPLHVFLSAVEDASGNLVIADEYSVEIQNNPIYLYASSIHISTVNPATHQVLATNLVDNLRENPADYAHKAVTAIAIGTDGNPIVALNINDTTQGGPSGAEIAHCNNPLCSSNTKHWLTPGLPYQAQFMDMKINPITGLAVIVFKPYYYSQINVASCADVACTTATISTLAQSVVQGEAYYQGVSMQFNSYGNLVVATRNDAITSGIDRLQVITCVNTACPNPHTSSIGNQATYEGSGVKMVLVNDIPHIAIKWGSPYPSVHAVQVYICAIGDPECLTPPSVYLHLNPLCDGGVSVYCGPDYTNAIGLVSTQ